MSPWMGKSNEESQKEETVEKINATANVDRLFSPTQDDIYFIKESDS